MQRSKGVDGTLRDSQCPSSAQGFVLRPDLALQAGEGSPSLSTWTDTPSNKSEFSARQKS